MSRVKKTIKVVDHAILRKSKKEPFMSSRDILKEINSQFRLNLSDGLYDDVLITESSLDALAERVHVYQKKPVVKGLTFAGAHKDKDFPFWKKIVWRDETPKMSDIKSTLC